jgi:predicted PurR-regulated permease PerM
MSEVTEKRRPGQYVVLGLLSALLFLVTYDALVPVLMGVLISMVCRPIFLRILRLFRQRNHLASIVCTLLLLVCVLVPLTLIAVSVLHNVASVVRTFSDSIHNQNLAEVQVLEIPIMARVYEKLNSIVQISQEEFIARFKEILVVVVSYGTKFVGGVAAAVPGLAASGFFFLISFYFGLVDGPALSDFIRNTLPFSEKETDGFFVTVSGISKGVVLGALASGLVQGIIIGLGYWIFGIPRPFFYGAITFILSFIPIFGTLPTGLGGILYLIFTHHYGAAIGMSITFVISSISDNVVKPWVLKGQSELHPLVGLISVLGGLRLFGFPGLLFGPLIAALTIAVIQFVLHPELRVEKVAAVENAV